MDMQLRAVARGPALRAAINLGNSALAREENGELRGITPALARRLSDEIAVPLELIVYDGAGKTFADAQNDRWDVAFLAVDPARAQVVDFTRPYKEIVAMYAAREDSAFQSMEEADAPGNTIIVAEGSAYDLHLSKTLKHAELIRAADPGESFARFRDGEGDLLAGVLESLQHAFPKGSAIRILPGRITSVRQAMVLPYHDRDRIAALDAFVERAITDGFIDANS